MKTLKPVATKRSGKQDREHKVLIGLIEYYLKTGKPVGSNTLKEAGFEGLSSATIRNYFAHLEAEGYLTQQHSSGGRIPTNSAFRVYAQEQLNQPLVIDAEDENLRRIRNAETREIASYLQETADNLSRLTHCAVFLSAPRFDQDLITELKLIPIDHTRCLCVIITEFGSIQTEVLHIDKKLSAHSAKRIENYLQARLHNRARPELEHDEEVIAKQVYNELMVRYFIGYSNFTDDEIYRTGFSKLLAYPEFHDAAVLSKSLSLFENSHSMRLLLKDCSKKNHVKFWIGEDLATYSHETPACSVIASPYHVGQQSVGALGILGPVRMPYRELFGLVNSFTHNISEALTRNIYKYKISFRQPMHQHLDNGRFMLLEDKR